MRKIILAAALLAVGASLTTARALDSSGQPVVVTPVRTTSVTSTGQPIVLPQGKVEVTASIYDIAPGATLPVHKHPFPRYGYMLSGTLEVTHVDSGKSTVFKAGDLIVEMVDQWHRAASIGVEPVKLLVIDQVEAGKPATVLKE